MEKTEKRIVIFIGTWALGVIVAVHLGWVEMIHPYFRAIPVVIGIIVPIVIYFRSESLREWVANFGIKGLSALHTWRIGAAAMFIAYGDQGLLPEIFVLNAGYGDLAVGILAGITLLLPETDSKYWVLHVFGSLDFVIAVGTGVFLSVTSHPLMANLFTLPIILIPFVLVGLSGASHVIAFHQLWTMRASNSMEMAIQTS